MVDKHLVLGVTGGIAVYKIPELISRLRRKGLSVEVVMTKSAAEFVTPLTFREITKNPVHTEMFSNNIQWNVEHIALARKADLIAIIPATANIIGKIANGIADDLLTATIMAADCPKLIAPAMNTVMYQNPAFQRNLQRLAGDGLIIIEPESGHLLCGDEGTGRLASLSEIEINIHRLLSAQDFKKEVVLVTAGGTREPIDPVRFIGNNSSGKMGHALAVAAFIRGAEVILVTAAMEVPQYKGLEVHRVDTTAAMREKVLEIAPNASLIIKAGAPADFHPACASERKIKKTKDGLDLHLAISPDILWELGQMKKKGQILVGFAAETDALAENAREKLNRKNLDLVVGNLVAESMGGDHSQATIFSGTAKAALPEMTKSVLADKILDYIVKYRTEGTI